MRGNSIDWRAILGAELFARMISELPDLDASVRAYAPRAVRLNRGFQSSDLPFATSQIAWLSAGRLVTDDRVFPGQFLQHAAGDYYVQDAGSMLPLALCDVQPGEMVCDTCAAPGGKSTGLLEQLDGRGVLVCNETIVSRLAPLRLTLARSGFRNYSLMNRQLDILAAQLGPSFDCVLVDAPCTGQSLVGQAKQSMSAFSEQQINHSSARQARIIRAAARLVRPGGRLVYATCSFSWAENEQVIRDFMNDEAVWEVLRYPRLEAVECNHQAGCYRLWPHRDRCAGAFAAALRRVEDRDCAIPQHLGATTKRWQALRNASGLPDWLIEPNDGRLLQFGEELHRFPEGLPGAWIDSSLSGSPVARLRTASSPKRSLSAQIWEPLFAAAKSIGGLDAELPLTELDDLQAKQYVAGNAISGDFENQGWRLLTWRGRKLAWGKMAGKVLKNHFPKGLRQRVEIDGGVSRS